MARRPDQEVIDLGHFVIMPIYLQILLEPKELAVLDTIRYITDNGNKPISYSLFVLYTGYDTKSIGAALKGLKAIGLITSKSVTKSGTVYSINENKLFHILQKLTMTKNPVQRLRIADKFRGQGRELHETLINKLSDSCFDSNL